MLGHSVHDGAAGTFNVAGDGVLLLSQAIRRLQRPSLPLPAFAVGSLGSTLRQARLADFSPEQLGLLTYGRGIDTTRMRDQLGFDPRFTTAEAFEDFGHGLTPTGGYASRAIDRAARLVEPSAGRSRGDGSPPWVTPRSSRSAPAAGPAAAAAPRARPRPPATSRAAAKAKPPAKRAVEPAPDADGRGHRRDAGRAARGACRARRRRRARPTPPKQAPGRPEEPAAAAAPAAARPSAPRSAGSPPGEWLGAFQFAAKEVFGDDWEPQLARFLAFLRRRVTGEYAVDEYGFDAEVTDRFLMAALRPIAEKWFRIEVHRRREHPRPRAVPWWCPTTRARCRWTR